MSNPTLDAPPRRSEGAVPPPSHDGHRTHPAPPAHGQVTMAKRHTWQVAMQVAAGKALFYAEQLRRKGRRVRGVAIEIERAIKKSARFC
jgi:hypothetical protein